MNNQDNFDWHSSQSNERLKYKSADPLKTI